MSNEVTIAEHGEMDRRDALASEFFDVTAPEVVPFVSDEATWFDFDYLDTEELASVVHAHYGVVLDDARLRLPFWQLLDFLADNRKTGPR